MDAIYTTTYGENFNLCDPVVDEYDLDDDAAIKRVSTPHMEHSRNGKSFCNTCGYLDGSVPIDPQFHPAAFVENCIKCVLCSHRAPALSAYHRHGKYIGDCCRDERTTE